MAEIVAAGEAVAAAAAGVAGLESDAVTLLEVLDFGADLDYRAGGFVAEDHGVLDNKVADGSVEPVVDIGAADARVVYCYEDVMGGLERGDGAFLEGDVVGLIEDEGKVLYSCVS